MEAPNPVFMAIFTVIFIAAWITAVVSWFRMVTAKDRKSYWKSIAMFAGPIILVFAIAELGGLSPKGEVDREPPPEYPQLDQVFDRMPLMQKVLLVAAGGTWILGGNLLFFAHNRRTKKKWWRHFNPLDPPFKDFNGKEWSILVGLVVVTMALGLAGLSQEQSLTRPPLNNALNPQASPAGTPQSGAH